MQTEPIIQGTRSFVRPFRLFILRSQQTFFSRIDFNLSRSPFEQTRQIPIYHLSNQFYLAILTSRSALSAGTALAS